MPYSNLVLLQNLYEINHGNGAKNYLINTYRKWQDGSVGMSGQTIDRVLEYVPKFLNVEQQFKILQFYVNQALASQYPILNKQESNSKIQTIKASDLFDLLTKILIHLKSDHDKYIKIKLDWFVQGIFSYEHISEFKRVLQFTIIDKIKRAYKDISSDFIYIKNLVDPVEYQMEFVKYTVKDLCMTLDINTLSLPEPSLLNQHGQMKTPRLISQYNDLYMNILLEYSADVFVQASTKNTKYRLASFDIKNVQSSLLGLTSNDEFDSVVEVMGRGGSIAIRFWKKNINELKLKLMYWWLSLPIWLVLTIGCIKAMWYLFPNLYIFTLVGFYFLHYFITTPIVNIKKINEEIRYER